MKSSLLWTVILCVTCITRLQAQCNVSNLSITVKNVTGNTSGCQVTLDVSFKGNFINGNKYAFIHLWEIAPVNNFPNLTHTPPTAAQLANAITTIVIKDPESSAAALNDQYPPDTSVRVTYAGVNFLKSGDLYTMSNVVINLSNCNVPVSIKGDIWTAPVTTNYQPTTDYSPIDYKGSVNNVLRNLTADESQLYYYGWPVSYAGGDKRGFMIRRGTVHTKDLNSDMVRFETSDGGKSWSRDSIFSEPGYDIRNYGGGTTSDGVILIFYGRLGERGWTSMRCMRSVNGGATWTHSNDLTLYPDSLTAFSPHGRLIELDNGDLLQSFYGTDASGDAYIYTLKSTDSGVTWGNPVLIAQGKALFEPSLVYLGGGKLIAGIRHDIGETDKDLEIYNSDNNGKTWDSIGKCLFTPSRFELAGISPLLFRKNADTATIVATKRGSYNGFIEITLPFGTNQSTGYRRAFYEGHSFIEPNNLEFGYPALMSFTDNEDDVMVAFYDVSKKWLSGDPKTDVFVSPVFRRVETITNSKINDIYAKDTSVFSPAVYVVDELACYNAPANPTYQHKIREAGSYSVHVEATFTGMGSSRTFNIQRYTSAGRFSENMHTESGSGNSYDFTTTKTMAANESIVLQIVHDANPLTVVNLRMTITKIVQNSSSAILGDSDNSITADVQHCDNDDTVTILFNKPVIAGSTQCTAPRKLNLSFKNDDTIDESITASVFIDMNSNGIIDYGDIDVTSSLSPALPASIHLPPGSQQTFTGLTYSPNANDKQYDEHPVILKANATVPGAATVTITRNNINFPGSCFTLPVILTSFTAKREGSAIHLQWETSSEQNNKGFAIERNLNGAWEEIAFIFSQAAGGNSASKLLYKYVDVNTSKKTSHYRLKQVDLDAAYKYSEVNSVAGAQIANTVIYPNPSSDGKVNFVIADANSPKDISILDMSGRFIKKWNNSRAINLQVDNLLTGLYMIRIIDKLSGIQITEKILVNAR